jgi:hypothetical protein
MLDFTNKELMCLICPDNCKLSRERCFKNIIGNIPIDAGDCHTASDALSAKFPKWFTSIRGTVSDGSTSMTHSWVTNARGVWIDPTMHQLRTEFGLRVPHFGVYVPKNGEVRLPKKFVMRPDSQDNLN